ncbi:MAG: cadherin-like beta sandwich domain-containing protein [Coriobacteriia bacterium]|nr:cadherin-like beta sandwich domain-containing protein [Coriobacteriia bacterium]
MNKISLSIGQARRRYFGQSLTRTLLVAALVAVFAAAMGVSAAYGQSGNPFLQQLEVAGLELRGPFRHTVTYYSVTVPEGMDSLTITAIPQETSARVTITGNEDLRPGVNYVVVRVTAENGVTLDYEIEAFKEGTVAAGNTQLRSLVVTRQLLTPAFRASVFEYTLDVAAVVSSLNIEATAVDPQATLHIDGADNLSPGSNEIVITVTSADGSQTQQYRIEVTRAEELAADDDDLVIDDDEEEVLHEPPDPQEWLPYVLIALGAAVLVAALTAVIALTRHKSRKRRH